MNSIHDMGGMDGFGPVQWEASEPAFHAQWEGRVRALTTLAIKKRIYSIHDSRHGGERMNPVFYIGSSYYQKWLLRMENLLKEKGVLTEEELNEKMAQIAPGITYTSHLESFRNVNPLQTSPVRRTVIETAKDAAGGQAANPPKFAPGTRVRVKVTSTLGHTRAPRYVRGKTGVIEEIHGSFILPDLKVHQGIDYEETVYRVRFEAQDLWGKDASPNDKLIIEMWEDYLELEESQHD